MTPHRSKGKTDWTRLRAQRNKAPAPSEQELKEARALWANADVIIPNGKTRMTVRFDTDVVEWFKKQGPKYQTRMNAVLRQFMSGQTAAALPPAVIEDKAEYVQALNQLGKISMAKGDLASASKYFETVVDSFERERTDFV